MKLFGWTISKNKENSEFTENSSSSVSGKIEYDKLMKNLPDSVPDSIKDKLKNLDFCNFDITEDGSRIIVELNIDADPESINASIEGDHLKVSVSNKKENKTMEDGWNLKMVNGSNFVRMIKLPSRVREDSIDTKYERGKIRITLSKV